MDTRRDFLKKASILSGGTGLLHVLPTSIAKALAINPAPGSSFYDAEHIVFLMQENRSFDHAYGTLQGVRGFNDPRAIELPNRNPVWLQTNKAGETFAPFRFDIKQTKVTWMHSLPHSWSDQVDARNNGRYNKWLDAKASGHEEYEQMPLTLGYYTRGDIPFYYSLADAFTVCDQNFCSSLTGTTPNRLYFWSGTIRENPKAPLANVWNEDADYDTMVNWKTFPERLEENGISWKVYQNELSVGVGFTEEEDAWLANYGDNPLEYFTQYQVKLSREYIGNLPKAAQKIRDEIKRREEQLTSAVAGSKEEDKLKKDIDWYKKQLTLNEDDQKNFTPEKYERLSQRDKNIHDKAFSTNRKDPDFHELTTFQYKDGDKKRELQIPKGDILHEFREDVKTKKLPTVSWLVAPANFSDHPSYAWYGAWYISEVMDILTRDPEVWKKTIFILTYDENDGFFDHIPPFAPPHPDKKGTGQVSKGIDTRTEWVIGKEQQSIQSRARDNAIGLGYRVPLLIASPWSRGGFVNSQVFDHTSSLMFLEKFLSKKFNKKIEEPNISEWRRTICGDLSSVFRPYNGEPIVKPEFLDKNEFIESIHKAQFKNPPSNFKKLSSGEIAQIKQNPRVPRLMPQQEKGFRSSCAIPYEFNVNGKLDVKSNSFMINFLCDNLHFRDATAGAPFQVYAPTNSLNDNPAVWNYAVKPGDSIWDKWSFNDFEKNQYHLRVYGPNGFYREFRGKAADPLVNVDCKYSKTSNGILNGNINLQIGVDSIKPVVVEIIDHAYKKPKIAFQLARSSQPITGVLREINISDSHNWYDFSVRIKGNKDFERRYAGHVETGKISKTDPFMARV